MHSNLGKLEDRVLFAAGETAEDSIESADSVESPLLGLDSELLNDSLMQGFDASGLNLGGATVAALSALLISQNSPDKFLSNSGVSQESLLLTLGGIYAINTVKEPVKAAFNDIVEQMNSLWSAESVQGDMGADDFDLDTLLDASTVDEIFGSSSLDFDISSEDLDNLIEAVQAAESGDIDLSAFADEGHWSDFIKEKSGAANGLYFLVAKQAAKIIIPKALAYAGLSVGLGAGLTAAMPVGVAGVATWLAADLVMGKAFTYALGRYTEAMTGAIIDALAPYGDQIKEDVLESLNDFQEWWSQPSAFNLEVIGDAMGAAMSSSAQALYSAALYAGSNLSDGAAFSSQKLMELNESFMDWWNQPSTFMADTLASAATAVNAAFDGAYSVAQYLAEDMSNDIDTVKHYGPQAALLGVEALATSAVTAYETHALEVGVKAGFKAGVKTMLTDNGTWWGFAGGKVMDLAGCTVINLLTNPDKH